MLSESNQELGTRLATRIVSESKEETGTRIVDPKTRCAISKMRRANFKVLHS